MKIIIIASGNGTRLWPVSTKKTPKQFTKLVDDEKSMIRLTYDRVNDNVNEVFVATRREYVDILKEQIPSIDDKHIIIEPEIKGTSNLILLSMDYLKRLKVDENEAICFVPSDHQVHDYKSFRKSLRDASIITETRQKICLIGAEAVSPSTQFGYIQKGEEDNIEDVKFWRVKSFKEKPNYEVATEYVESGEFYWNCGIFVMTRKVLEKEISQYAKDLAHAYAELTKKDSILSDDYNTFYSSLHDDSIDYSLIEKVDELFVISAPFDWMDVGSFNQLHDIVETDSDNNYICGKNCIALNTKNSYIRSDIDSDKKIAVVGLDNVVVVNTDAGLLVINKNDAHLAGEFGKMA